MGSRCSRYRSLKRRKQRVLTKKNFFQGVEATSVDTSANTVRLSNGRELQYDKLYVATGCKPRKPNIPGADLKNVCVLKDYDDSA